MLKFPRKKKGKGRRTGGEGKEVKERRERKRDRM